MWPAIVPWPAQSLPRILLIVDEFQELFTEDDKLAQDAALLLDRLVRQGRAFGMHVLLGSQTLGGAYSLARSTIGQMAVRIALQCSEADANLILSEENSAARLLSRPGEAIYNDANGLVQGNHPFQIVWLPEERRERYLQELQQMAEHKYAAQDEARPPAPIVFEGNVPADIRRNKALNELLRAADWPVQSAPVHAWLGEAIAIKDPTAAVFRPQSGDNLLIVGQRPGKRHGAVGRGHDQPGRTTSSQLQGGGSGLRICRRQRRAVLRGGTRSAGRFADRPFADRFPQRAGGCIVGAAARGAFGRAARFAGAVDRSFRGSAAAANRGRSTRGGDLSDHFRHRPFPRSAPRRRRLGLLVVAAKENLPAPRKC